MNLVLFYNQSNRPISHKETADQPRLQNQSDRLYRLLVDSKLMDSINCYEYLSMCFID